MLQDLIPRRLRQLTKSKYSDMEKLSPSEESLLNDDDSTLDGHSPEQRTPYRSNCGHIICLSISSVFLFVSLLLFGQTIQSHRNLDQTCVQRHNSYSPALGIIEYSEVQMNGSLNFPSEYRGRPSEELDAAWKRISDVGAFSLPEEEISKLHVDPVATKLRKGSGGGYMAGLEVFHQLHCLNMLRQLTWGDYYHDKEAIFTDRPEILRWHTDHCIEMLRQKLMCDADVGVITYNWVPRREYPFPNFNVWHQCRNFEGVLRWGRENEAPDQLDSFTKDLTLGDVEVPVP